jgi:hypothetical protein
MVLRHTHFVDLFRSVQRAPNGRGGVRDSRLRPTSVPSASSVRRYSTAAARSCADPALSAEAIDRVMTGDRQWERDGLVKPARFGGSDLHALVRAFPDEARCLRERCEDQDAEEIQRSPRQVDLMNQKPHSRGGAGHRGEPVCGRLRRSRFGVGAVARRGLHWASSRRSSATAYMPMRTWRETR